VSYIVLAYSFPNLEPVLEPDILECEVKWALESITMNKASGGDGIPVELFQILKDDAVKVLHSICQQIGKLSSGHRTGKGQFSFQRNPRADLLQNGLVGSPCSPRESQESSPTPQFKSINSSALSLLHSPTLTSIHDHRKNYSLD